MTENDVMDHIRNEIVVTFKEIKSRLVKFNDINSALQRIGDNKYKDTENIGNELIQLRSETAKQISMYLGELNNLLINLHKELKRNEHIICDIKPYQFRDLTDNQIPVIIYGSVGDYFRFKKHWEDLEYAYRRLSAEDVGKFSKFRIRRALNKYFKKTCYEYGNIIGIIIYTEKWIDDLLKEFGIYDKVKEKGFGVETDEKDNEMNPEANLFVIDTPSIINPDLMLTKEPAEIYDKIGVETDEKGRNSPFVNEENEDIPIVKDEISEDEYKNNPTVKKENSDDEITRLKYPELNSD